MAPAGTRAAAAALAGSLALPVAATGLVPAEMPESVQVIAVERLAAAPLIDGDGGDWPAGEWQVVAVRPAIVDDDRNRVGEIDVRLRAGVREGRVYFLVRWPDARPDTRYRPWRWDGSRYRRGKRDDDMFAFRFDLAGDYDSCMLTDREYRVDVWLWSAGRSDPTGYADDGWQLITTRLLENAAEHTGPSGSTVYIRKSRDAGEPGYAYTRPDRKRFAGDRLPGVERTGAASGSVADVTARGTWADGYWTVELSRALATGHEDDAEFVPGATKRGALAVFDRASAEHKSVSGDLDFAFPARP